MRWLEFPSLKTGKSRQSISASLFARLRRFATDEAYQRGPRAGRMPRSLSALVIASSVVAPVLRIASMTGRRPDANWSAAAIWICRPHTPAAAMFGGCWASGSGEKGSVPPRSRPGFAPSHRIRGGSFGRPLTAQDRSRLALTKIARAQLADLAHRQIRPKRKNGDGPEVRREAEDYRFGLDNQSDFFHPYKANLAI